MNVFIGWSGQRGLKLAEAVKQWVAQVLPEMHCFVSLDLPKGMPWFQALAQELEAAQVGIMCIAPPRLAGEWQLVEAGAIWKAAQAGRLFPVCFDVSKADIPEPLQAFQVTEFHRSDFERLAHDLAGLAGLQTVSEQMIRSRFEDAWPAIESAVRAALQVPDEAVHEVNGFICEVCGGWWERVYSEHGRTRLSWMLFERSAQGGLTIHGSGFGEDGSYTSEWRTELAVVDAEAAEPLVTYFWEGRHPNKAPHLLFGGKCWFRFALDADGRMRRGTGEFTDMCLNPREASGMRIHDRNKPPTIEFDLQLAPTTKKVDLLRATPGEEATMRGTDNAARRALAKGKLGDWE